MSVKPSNNEKINFFPFSKRTLKKILADTSKELLTIRLAIYNLYIPNRSLTSSNFKELRYLFNRYNATSLAIEQLRKDLRRLK